MALGLTHGATPGREQTTNTRLEYIATPLVYRATTRAVAIPHGPAAVVSGAARHSSARETATVPHPCLSIPQQTRVGRNIVSWNLDAILGAGAPVQSNVTTTMSDRTAAADRTQRFRLGAPAENRWTLIGLSSRDRPPWAIALAAEIAGWTLRGVIVTSHRLKMLRVVVE